jgi:Family of unknown function (DUF5767)
MSVQFAEGGSKPSVQELAAFASRGRDIDVGGGDDIIELGDDLGLGLIANQNKIAASPKTSGSGGAPASRQVNFSSGGGGVSEMPQIQIKPIDDLEAVSLDAAPGVADIRINRGGDGGAEPAPFVINTGGGSAMDFGGGSDSGAGSSSGGGMSPEEEAKEKQRMLTKLRRLEADGLKGNRMTMANSLEEIKAEYDGLTDSKNLEASIRFQRNALMTFVSGIEMVNDKIGHRLPVKPRLKGWSESVHTNISDFDDIFEELYDLYKDKAKMHPLLRLVGTLGVSATMYHLTNTMAERSGIPGMADLMNDDPELQRMIAAKMAAKMGGGLGGFMSAASGMGPSPMGGGGPGPAPMGYGAPPPPSPPRAAASGRAPFNMASAAEPPKARREMRGPTGVDDILKAFETERLMQQASEAPPVHPSVAGVFTPSGKPPSPPRGVQILREGVGGHSDPMADFINHMDDAGSIGTTSTMNTERRRGRRRAVATPVGTTLDLNV